MRSDKLQEHCIGILSLKDQYIRGRINQMLNSSPTHRTESELSEKYIQDAVAEFYSFRKKMLAYDSSILMETLDIILNTEYGDFNDLHFSEPMETFFGSKHTIGFVSAYNDFAEDFNALLREFLVIKAE